MGGRGGRGGRVGNPGMVLFIGKGPPPKGPCPLKNIAFKRAPSSKATIPNGAPLLQDHCLQIVSFLQDHLHQTIPILKELKIRSQLCGKCY